MSVNKLKYVKKDNDIKTLKAENERKNERKTKKEEENGQIIKKIKKKEVIPQQDLQSAYTKPHQQYLIDI